MPEFSPSIPAPARIISFVIPAYNEERRIGRTLDEIRQFLASQRFPAEVIVVDDGSSDQTQAIAASHIERYKEAGYLLTVLRNSPNRGKGYSVRRGVEAANGEIVLFTDADLASPISESPKLLAPLLAGQADLTMGSRALDRGLIAVRQPKAREWAGRTFNVLVRLLTGLDFKDTQCGFKAFNRRLLLPAFRVQRIERFGFDPELLYVARKLGLRAMELPVVWNHQDGSKVRFFQDSLRMLAELVTIRVNDLSGAYETAVRRHEEIPRNAPDLPPPRG